MDLVAEEEPRSGAEVAAQMAASGALDEIFSKIDAGELDLTGVTSTPYKVLLAVQNAFQGSPETG